MCHVDFFFFFFKEFDFGRRKIGVRSDGGWRQKNLERPFEVIVWDVYNRMF